MKSALFLSLLGLIIIQCGCKQEEIRVCEIDDAYRSDVVVLMQQENDYRHFDRNGNRYLVGEEVSVIDNRSFTTSTFDNVVTIDGLTYDYMESFTLPPGEYTGFLSLRGCILELNDNTSCRCRPEQFGDEFELQFIDSSGITIDSVRFVRVLECENQPGGCGIIELLVDWVGYSVKHLREEFMDGRAFQYDFVSAEEFATVTLMVEGESFKTLEYEFNSDMTNSWSEGWHSSENGELLIKVSRQF